MKSLRVYMLFYVLLITLLFSCKEKKREQHLSHTDVYTCSMHPQIIRHKPGNCPICGMTLIKKEEKAESIKDISLETLLKPTNEFVISKIPVATLEQRVEQPTVQALGTVQYDDRQMGTVSSRLEGRIEKLYVKYRYQHVQKGDRLLDIYSPELLTSQQNLLFLLQNDPDNSSLISAARARLLLLGMSAAQIAQAVKSGKPLYSVSVYSNYTGYVNDPGVNEPDKGNGSMPAGNNTNYNTTTQELMVKEGMYLQKGQPVFTIMNGDRALVVLNIFSADQNIIRQGDAVKIIPDASRQSFTASISYIEPFFAPGSKTLAVRVYINNSGLKLPIGSSVQASILASKQNGNWLPADAVYTLGLNQIVFKKEGDAFKAFKVTTGNKTQGYIQIVSGLSQTDSVAVNAHFLTDNESFIKVE